MIVDKAIAETKKIRKMIEKYELDEYDKRTLFELIEDAIDCLQYIEEKFKAFQSFKRKKEQSPPNVII